jgi:hypothetical protein
MAQTPDPAAGPDLLADPLFTVEDELGDRLTLSLPMLLARLLAGEEVSGFPHLTAEQRGYFWRFVVRCAAKALHEMGMDVDAAARATRQLADGIMHVLAELTPAGAWLLYQPDSTRPGFLQIPTPDGKPPGKENNYKANPVSLLTSTIGGKNHERKSEVTRELTPEEALYAVIEYQTASIYKLKQGYESQLTGTRDGAGSGVPFMGARIGGSNGMTFRHDVRVLLDQWPDIMDVTGLQGDIWALWVEPWDGKSQIGAEHLDPSFIPVARMIRLDTPENGVFRHVWFRETWTGGKPRVRDHTGGGRLGDPFTPLVPDPKTGIPKVRGTLRDGYSYAEVVRLLFGDEQRGGTPSPSVQALAGLDDQLRLDLRVLFEGTAYERGKTGGFHRREVLLPAQNVGFISDPVPLRAAHAEMLQRVKDAKSALRGAARILLTGELKPRPGDEGKTGGPVTVLDQRVDAAYLEQLFAATERKERGDENWLQPWLDWLAEQTWDVFRGTRGMLPTTTGRLWEREIDAEGYLQHKLYGLRGGQRGDASDEEPPETDLMDSEELAEEEIA